jgi:peptidoglycan/LPS O-acetylase OafA/YrhL
VFYAACAVLFWSRRLDRWEASVLVSLAAAAACAWIRHESHRKLPVALFIALALMFLGDGFRRRADGRVSAGRLGALAGVVLAALWPICMTAYGDEGLRYLSSYAGALAVFAAAFLARRRMAGGGGASRIARFLANCSYGVYLLHAPVGLPAGGLVLRTTGSALAGAAAMLAATTLLAFGMYTFIEAPGIRWGRKVAGRARGPAAAERPE